MKIPRKPLKYAGESAEATKFLLETSFSPRLINVVPAAERFAKTTQLQFISTTAPSNDKIVKNTTQYFVYANGRARIHKMSVSVRETVAVIFNIAQTLIRTVIISLP